MDVEQRWLSVAPCRLVVVNVSTDIALSGLETQVGRLSIAATAIGLLALEWGEPGSLLDRLVSQRLARPVAPSALAVEHAAQARGELSEYFAGDREQFEVALDWQLTTGGGQAVLMTLHDSVGFGESVTYGELAKLSGTGIPARGIGAVMGANPLPIVVPCHRVLAAGGLGGYSGGQRDRPAEQQAGSSPYGLETKRWLLTFEGVLPPTLGWDPTQRLDLGGTRPQLR